MNNSSSRTMEVNFKVVLKYGDNTTEIRRFELSRDIKVISLLIFKEQILTLCPDLLGKDYRIYWIDAEDDEVEIKTDRDMLTALKSMPALKKFYISCNKPGQEKKETKEIHHLITCDECKKTVAGFRYKCLQCPDYDLCENCESKHLHSNHIMMRIPKVLPLRRFHHCWSKIHHSVDYLAKYLESPQHSEKDHSERNSRKCSGRHRRYCNWDDKDSDGGADESKDKSEGGKDEKCGEGRGIPFGLFFSPDGPTMPETCEATMQDFRRHSHDIEDAVVKTVKFFVDAVKDGFTPKTRSERGKGESSPVNPGTEAKEDTEKMKSGQGAMSKTNEEKEWKLSEKYVPGTTAEPFPVPSAPRVETTEKETETERTGNLYPTVPMDPKIEEALNGMLAMGFSNEGGTLQKIVEEMDGDIMKVLECIDSSLN